MSSFPSLSALAPPSQPAREFCSPFSIRPLRPAHGRFARLYLKAFCAAVLGGIGNIPGAALGGLIIGIVETFVAGSPEFSTYRDAIAFAILILILLIKPSGLLGKKEIEKV